MVGPHPALRQVGLTMMCDCRVQCTVATAVDGGNYRTSHKREPVTHAAVVGHVSSATAAATIDKLAEVRALSCAA